MTLHLTLPIHLPWRRLELPWRVKIFFVTEIKDTFLNETLLLKLWVHLHVTAEFINDEIDPVIGNKDQKLS